MEHERKWQWIDLEALKAELEPKMTQKKKMDYLSGAYPSLYILILKHFKMQERVEQYIAKCKEFENDKDKYSLYIHGYWLNWLDQ